MVKIHALANSLTVFGLSLSLPCAGMVPPATAELSVCVVLIGAPYAEASKMIRAVLMLAPKP